MRFYGTTGDYGIRSTCENYKVGVHQVHETYFILLDGPDSAYAPPDVITHTELDLELVKMVYELVRLSLTDDPEQATITKVTLYAAFRQILKQLEKLHVSHNH